MLSMIAIGATAAGSGPFGGEKSGESLLSLQAFIGLTTVMALTLASAVSGHRNSERELRSLSVEMEQLALTDELTGLRNRRGFLVLADQALRMARRTRARCALVFMDLDGLKRVNDTRGHAAGDTLIADAAKVLDHVFRESDVVARVGGDEFAVLAVLDESRRRERAQHAPRRGDRQAQRAGGSFDAGLHERRHRGAGRPVGGAARRAALARGPGHV